jgi:hypothetical protein
MGWFGDLAKQGADSAGAFIADNLKKAIGAAVLALLTAAWLYLWAHFNPQFRYAVPLSSSGASHFVSLAQALNQIDKDSHVYCSGGWDERIARFALRKCYHFSFSPIAVYRLFVCSHDQRTVEVTTSDQLVALQTFRSAFKPLACFQITPKGQDDYEVVPGSNIHFRPLQFAGEPAQDTAFCGCTDREESEIARLMGATLR